MNKKTQELSVFFPFWNEEKNVEPVVDNAVKVLEKIADRWEVIMIDDGSSDDTLKICHKLAKKDSRLYVVSHASNRGYGAALKDGFSYAKYKLIVFTDGDGQFDFSEVIKFIEKVKNVDMVIGYRKKRQDNFIRHMLMNLLKIWDYLFFGFYYKDIDCGFKMFKKEAVDRIMPLQSEGAMITTEILVKAKLRKLNISEAEVTHYPRRYGDQSGGNVYVVIRAILESFNLWWNIVNGRI